MSFGRFIQSVRFSNRATGAGQHDGRHRRINYNLCTALDITKLSCVLQEMIDAEIINEAQAAIYHDQAGGLLALLCTENNRAHGA